MKLAKLLELQNIQNDPMVIPQLFGDGFLVKNNLIYKKIRSRVIESGFIYSSKLNEDYILLPLGYLENILQSKIIPYYENTKVLTKIESKIPQMTIWDQLTDHLKKNYTFHESCHAVSRIVFSQIFTIQATQNEKVLQLFLEEAFANSCELIAIKDVTDTAHKIFYEFNSYIYVIEFRSLILQLIAELGFKTVFKLVMLSYLHSLFLNDVFSENIFNEILKFSMNPIELQQAPIKKLKSLMSIAFELNPRFKSATTSFYLNYYQVKFPDKMYLSKDYINELKNDVRYSQFIDELILIIE